MIDQPQIILVDNLDVRKINLQIGDNNIIGNDPNTISESESALEQAVKISLSDGGEMSITPCEGISCYMKSYGSHRWTLLKSNKAEALRLRDTCLLKPVKIWFRVISAMEGINESTKRKVEEIVEDEPPDKKYCSEYSREVECLNYVNNNNKELNIKDCVNTADKCENNDVTDVLEAPDLQSDQPEVCSMDAESEKIKHYSESNDHQQNGDITNIVQLVDSNKNNDEVLCNSDQGVGDQLNNSDLSENQQKGNENEMSISNEDNQAQCNTDQGDGVQLSNSDLTENQQEDNANATSSNNEDNATAANVNMLTIPREKCKYGRQCYRLNAEHKAKFSHVGDDDYEIPDNRPECPYGTNCYRKNPLHKQNYKHSRNKRQAAINSLRNISAVDSDSDQSIQESVDESDYEDSFIDDDDIESLEEYLSDFEDEND